MHTAVYCPYDFSRLLRTKGFCFIQPSVALLCAAALLFVNPLLGVGPNEHL